MSIQFTASGSDSLGSFVVFMPGHCKACNKDTDVVLRYHASQLRSNLIDSNIDPHIPSLVVMVNKKVAEIGVTCGCYAKFHRQIAHISAKGQSRKKG